MLTLIYLLKRDTTEKTSRKEKALGFFTFLFFLFLLYVIKVFKKWGSVFVFL